MALDFRANQLRGNKLISSGSTGTGAKLVFYDISADSVSNPNQGNINIAVFGTSSIGTDVFLFVSGGIGQKSVPNSNAITAFGGDVFMSGNLSLAGSGSNNAILYVSGAAGTYPFNTNLPKAIFGADIIASGNIAFGSNSYVPYNVILGRTSDQGLVFSASNLVLFASGGNSGKILIVSSSQNLNTIVSQVDTFMYVSGAINGTNQTNGGITVFGGDIVVSGNINIKGATNITASLGGGGSTLQQAYYSGSTIALVPLSGSIKISGDLTSTNSASIRITPTTTDQRAIAIYDTTDTYEHMVLMGKNSTFGGSAIIMRSQGSIFSYIAWANTATNQLGQNTSTNLAAVIKYLVSGTPTDELIIQPNTAGGQVSIAHNNTYGGNIATFVNGAASTTAYVYLLPAKNTGTVFVSGNMKVASSGTFQTFAVTNQGTYAGVAATATDAIFFVSGTQNSAGNNKQMAVMATDMVVSGNVFFISSSTNPYNYIASRDGLGGMVMTASNVGLVALGSTGKITMGRSLTLTTAQQDTMLFVSGTIGGKDSSTGNIAVFGGDLHVSGNITTDGTTVKITTYTGSFTLSNSDSFVHVSTTGSVVSMSLPPSTLRQWLISKTTGSNSIVVLSGSILINNSASNLVLPGSTADPTQNTPQSWLIYGDGTNYWVR